jgi:hypothetical protein
MDNRLPIQTELSSGDINAWKPSSFPSADTIDDIVKGIYNPVRENTRKSL